MLSATCLQAYLQSWQIQVGDFQNLQICFQRQLWLYDHLVLRGKQSNRDTSAFAHNERFLARKQPFELREPVKNYLADFVR